MQFYTNGVAFGSAQSLTAGIGMLTTTLLVAGTYPITAGYSGDANFDINSVSNSLFQTVNGFTAWTAAIKNGLTNDTDCAVGDGYPNLLKYVTGSNPTNHDTMADMGCVMSNGLFWIRFYRNTNVWDATLFVEAKTNLMDSSWLGVASNTHNNGWSPLNLVDETGSGVTNPVTTSVKDNSVLSQRFMRLRATRP